MKKFWIFCALVFAVFSGHGQTTLAAGELVILGYNATGNGGNTNAPSMISLLARKSLSSGTEIFITNQKWNGSGFNAVNTSNNVEQGTIRVTFNEPISVGQIIEIQFNKTTNSLKTTVGLATYTAGSKFDFDPSSAENEVYCYQYASSTYTFLTGIVWDNSVPSAPPPGMIFSGSTQNAFCLGVNGNSYKCGVWVPSTPTTPINFNADLNTSFYAFADWLFVQSNNTSSKTVNGITYTYCPCNPDTVSTGIENLFAIVESNIAFSKYLYSKNGIWRQLNEVTGKWEGIPGSTGEPDWSTETSEREVIINKSLSLGPSSSPFGSTIFECATLTVQDTLGGEDGVTLSINPGNALKINYELNFVDAGGVSKPSLRLKSAHAAGQTYYAKLDPTSATLDDPDGEFIYDLHVQYPGWHHFQSPISTTFANVSATAISPATSTFTFTAGAVGTGNTFSWNPTTSQWAQISTADNFSSTPYTVLFQTTEVPCVLTVRGTLASPDQDAVANLTANYHDPTSNGNVPGWTSDGDDGWNFYGNPYISALSTEDLLGIYSSNGNGLSNKMSGLDNKVYVWQPNSTVTNQTSDYRTKTYLNTSGTFAHGGDATAQYLPPFQAFFMRRGSGNANTTGFVKSKKYRKTTSLTSSNSIVNKTSGMTSQYELMLKNLGTNIVSTLYTVPFGKNRFVDLSGDVLAFNNTTTFGMAYDSMLFAIKFWPISQEDTSSIDVLVSHPVQGESFVLSSPNLDAYILDKAMGTLHSFQQGDYSFSHDSAYNASARFQWIFAPNATVGIEETLLPPVPLKVKVGAFQVEFEYPEDVAIHILDLQGREVMKGAIINGSFIWETSHQAPGAYVITSEMFSEKFILP